MKKKIILLGFSLLILTGCNSSIDEDSSPIEERVEVVEETITEVEVNEKNEIIEEPEAIAENLNIPWAIDKHGETIFITERLGSIIKIENGQIERQTVKLKKELSSAAEAGLLGFVLAPDFQDTNHAYAYYTYEDGAGQFNRIIMLELDDDTWHEVEVLLDEIPSGTVHHGGRIKIGPDNMLYATAGDAAIPGLAQDPNSLAGKILRMELDGSIPNDNPFDNYIYSLGHRNPQGLTWSDNGTLYASEHGNNANDEINLIEAGENYGWPIIEGTAEQEGMQTPIFTSGEDTTWAPSGMIFHEQKLLVAALRGAGVYSFDLENNQVDKVMNDYGRVRDIYLADDMMYFITNNTDGRGSPAENDDKLYRISISEIY